MFEHPKHPPPCVTAVSIGYRTFVYQQHLAFRNFSTVKKEHVGRVTECYYRPTRAYHVGKQTNTAIGVVCVCVCYVTWFLTFRRRGAFAKKKKQSTIALFPFCLRFSRRSYAPNDARSSLIAVRAPRCSLSRPDRTTDPRLVICHLFVFTVFIRRFSDFY